MRTPASMSNWVVMSGMVFGSSRSAREPACHMAASASAVFRGPFLLAGDVLICLLRRPCGELLPDQADQVAAIRQRPGHCLGWRAYRRDGITAIQPDLGASTS